MMHSADSRAPRAPADAITTLLQAPALIASSFASALGRRSSGCEIPPPCWEPRPAGTCTFDVAPGGTATLRVHVFNCGWGRQVAAMTALGKLAAWMTFAPTTLVLDPQERATFLVTIHAPDKVPPGTRLSAPVIVRGCLNHYVRVEVTVAECAGRNCCDVSIDDCQDHVHHWYDHFYCPRPCQSLRVPGATEVQDG